MHIARNEPPATYNQNEIHHDWTAPLKVLGNQINIVADDSPPHVMRNVASYYRQKGEPWADAMARRLVAANDNKRGV